MTEEKKTTEDGGIPKTDSAAAKDTPETEPLQTGTADSADKAVPETAQAAGEAEESDHRKEKKSEIRKWRSEAESAKKALEAEKNHSAELTDKYTRLCAEYDNFRKRSQKEKEGIYGDAVAATLKGLLPVIDNLQYASRFGNADPEKFAEGVRLILDKLPETLEKLHITPVGAPGETFDPTLHNAVMHEENAEYGEGEIIEVLQSGYKYEDRVIRYAMVKVAN